MEKCRKCGVELVIGKNWTIGKKNGSDFSCRECSTKRTREWAKTHRKNCSEMRKRYLLKLRVEVFTHYSGNPPHCQCSNCNETEIKFLTIDHINGDGAKQRRQTGSGKHGGRNFYNWLKRNNYPEGFRVLCFNCNCGRQLNNGICPHCQKS